MSLPTCPSCGQSVLEDNAVDCPFCGAAMDGSRGAKNTPRPKANPVVNRPGARKPVEKPEASAPGDTIAAPPKPVSRPVAGGRSGKTVVDEDDPFGIGSAATSNAIQATLKPEKGRLLKVVCPMCEQVGFVPKNATGKSVRCANEKCMVPVFTAPDPTGAGEKRPARLSDGDVARPSKGAAPTKRNPLLVYGIVGAVLVVVTLVVISILNRPVDNSNLAEKKVFTPEDFGPTPEEIAAKEKAEAAKKQALLDAVNPAVEAGNLAGRMIILARQSQLRDEALARSMTADIYLRLADATKAALELSLVVKNDRTRGAYRIDPHLVAHWRAVKAGDEAAAKKSLNDALADRNSIPRSGRLAIDTSLGLAAALFRAGESEQAIQLVTARQLDVTIPANRDLLVGTAWLFSAARCRDLKVPVPAVIGTLAWTDPLATTVAFELAVHEQWEKAIAWSKLHSDAKVVADSLVAVAEIAAIQKAAPAIFDQLDQAAQGDPVASIRVRAAVAAASKDSARLDAVIQSLTALETPAAMSIPTSIQMAQQNFTDRSQYRERARAAAETVRAAVLLGATDKAGELMSRFLLELSAWSPPAALVRVPANRMVNDEGAFKRELAADFRAADDSRFNSMFRSYRRYLDRLSEASEDCRLTCVLSTARIIRSGGAGVVTQAMTSHPEYQQQIFLDELSGFVSMSARSAGVSEPALLTPDPSLQNGKARFGESELLLAPALVAGQVWANKADRFAECLRALELQAGRAMPTLRQALLSEIVESEAKSVSSPETILTPLLQIQNGIWREEALQTAGRYFANRKLNEQIDAWLNANRVPSMEQLALLYGTSLGLLDRKAGE